MNCIPAIKQPKWNNLVEWNYKDFITTKMYCEQFFGQRIKFLFQINEYGNIWCQIDGTDYMGMHNTLGHIDLDNYLIYEGLNPLQIENSDVKKELKKFVKKTNKKKMIFL